ncbi:MAG: RecB family exonuclease [Acidimicrobiales bacterium]
MSTAPCLIPVQPPGATVTVPEPAAAEVAVPDPSVRHPRHLSPTAAATFEQCPRRWRFRYVERLPDPPGLAALAGTLVHRVLERLLAEPAGDRHLDRARHLATEEWPTHQALPEVADLGLDADGQRQYKWKVWQAVAGLWDLEDPASVEVLATESPLDVQLGEVPFLGVLDRVERTAQGVAVTDYKSGRAPKPAYEAAKLDQVLLYAAGWREQSGTEPVRARLLYLGSRTIEIEVTPDRLDEAVGRLGATWEALNACVSSERFEPRTGPLCAWCPYTRRCPEGSNEVRRRFDAGMVPADAPALRPVA